MFKLTAALVLSTVALSDAVTEYKVVGCFGLFGCMTSTLFCVEPIILKYIYQDMNLQPGFEKPTGRIKGWW